MSNSAQHNDSSMDDILASIRNIISDDVKQSVGARAPEKKEEPAVIADTQEPSPEATPETTVSPVDDEISVTLTESISQTPSAEGSITERIRSRIRAETSTDKTPFAREDEYAKPSPVPDVLSDVLHQSVDASVLDPETADYAADEDFKMRFKRKAAQSAYTGSSRSEVGTNGLNIESLVRESLEKILREWMDANLTAVVRDVVTDHLEKLLAGRHK